MTAVVKRDRGLNSKKGRQLALESKINEIDARLKELGVADVKYRVVGTVINIETSQNTVNISGCVDIQWMFRVLAHYKAIQHYHKLFCKDAGIQTPLLTDRGGHYVQDIIHDLELRIVYVSNMAEITRLNQIKEELMPFMNEESRFISALKRVDSLLKA